MINKILFPETIVLYLYKETFILRKGLSFSRYMKILDEMDFSPHIFVIKEVQLFGSYFLETYFSPSFIPILPPISDHIILNRCLIRYSKDNREITLEAGVSIGLILMNALYFLMIVVMLGVAVTALSLIPLVIAALIIILLVSVYNRDVKRYEKMKIVALKKSSKRNSDQ